MSKEKDDFERAYEIWKDFKDTILYKNRFLRKHRILPLIKHLAYLSQDVVTSGTLLYRARIFKGNEDYLRFLNSDNVNATSDDDINTDQTIGNYTGDLKIIRSMMFNMEKASAETRLKSGFLGYDAKNSFIPQDSDIIMDGRANPAYIKYLYTAEDPYTALVEVRPYLDSKISIAEIKINSDMRVADFTHNSIDKFEGFEQYLIYLIMRDFSAPSDSDQKIYIPTQYISEFIKSIGLDGIRFNSSLYERGRNITIFNYNNCEPISSKLYQLKDICFEAKSIAPPGSPNLLHWKLQNYYLLDMSKKIKNAQ